MKLGEAGVTSYKHHIVYSIVDLLVVSLFVGRRAGWGYDYYILHGTLVCMAECKSILLISKGRYLEVWQRVVVSIGIFWS